MNHIELKVLKEFMIIAKEGSLLMKAVLKKEISHLIILLSGGGQLLLSPVSVLVSK